MAMALADFESRLAAYLMDSGAAIWSGTYLAVALRMALEQYSRVNPLTYETVITLPGDAPGNRFKLAGGAA